MEHLPKQGLIYSFLSIGQVYNEDLYKRFDRLAEIFTWVSLIIGVLVVQFPFAQEIDKDIVYGLVIGIGIFVLIWYHFLPKKISIRTRSFIYSLIVNLLIAFVVHFTGGIQSYVIFLYFITNLRVGMTMPLSSTVLSIFFTTSLMFGEAFLLTEGKVSTNMSLAALQSFALVLVVFFGRFYSGQASLVREQEEEITLDKEKYLGKLKDEFVFIISRELKQPNDAIKRHTDKILRDYSNSLNSEAKEVLDLTKQNNDRLAKLLDDLTDVSKIEGEGLEVRVSDIFLKPVISEVLSNQYFDAKNKKIALSQKGDVDVAVKADIDRLKEVLTNLVNNAIKYTKEGGQIVVDVKNEGDFAQVAVTDNGVGISEEDQRHLFEKFYRVDNKETKAIKGNGLGLFITKNLVEKMGGEIGVMSKLGKGTVFYFKLPRYRW